MIRLFDTHCHLNHLDLGRNADDDTATDWRATWQRACDVGVLDAVVVGTDLASSLEARRVAAEHSERSGAGRLFWSAGLHPTEARDLDRALDDLRALILAPTAEHGAGAGRPVAVGETGFDFYWDKSTPAEQRRSFDAQLDLALEAGLPVIIHCRDAFDATFEALEARGGAHPPAVMHCFAGGPREAERALALDLYLSFAGPLTYPRSEELRQAAAQAPVDRILIETDSPFLPPQGHRGKRNEPAWITRIATTLAEVRGTDLSTLAAQTSANARRFFALD